jgi:choline dehydrogenase-like flavoprotein
MYRSENDPDECFDFVVVGAGPAGCAVAARLADGMPGATVALIEAGPPKGNLLSDVPLGLILLIARKSKFNYAYETIPQSGLNNRRGFQPRGRGVGGSSLINGMVYIRGQHEDYDSWAAAGCTGWAWEDVLPLFKRLENNCRGADAWRGTDGPLQISDSRGGSPVMEAFIKAGMEAGFPFNPDFNGATQEGVGRYQVYQANGRRHDAGTAYIWSRNRSNLKVVSDTRVERVEIRNGRATGVLVSGPEGTRVIGARSEVILSGGVFGSPQLLMLSGVGPAAHLREYGIGVNVDAPNVGENLQDHLDHSTLMRMKGHGAVGLTLPGVARYCGEAVRFLRHSRGALTSNGVEAGAFVKTDPSLDRPDIQFHFCNGIVEDHLRKLHLKTGISLHTCVLRPASRGTVRLGGPDASSPPVIDPRFLSAESDLRTLSKGIRIARKILRAPSLAALGGKPLHDDFDKDDDASIEKSIRKHSDTIYHPVGTCRMGSDSVSVVDPALRVRGLRGLRIADASIMPTLVSGNTQAASAMIGEKAADLVIQSVRNG